jgi:hypothetical protein
VKIVLLWILRVALIGMKKLELGEEQRKAIVDSPVLHIIDKFYVKSDYRDQNGHTASGSDRKLAGRGTGGHLTGI